MTRGDILGLILSYIYAFGLLFGVEALGKRLQWPQRVTRKIVHIGAGMWIWGILALFEHKVYGIIPFATFIVLNYIFYRRRAFQTMDGTESSPGTVYFAISITVLFLWLWRPNTGVDRVPLAAGAIMVMTWGDGLASLVGGSWGRRTYSILEHERTWEGTITMAVASFVALLLTFMLLPNSALSPNSLPMGMPLIVVLSVLGTFVGTFAEAVTPAGMDNLTVPLLTGVMLHVIESLR